MGSRIYLLDEDILIKLSKCSLLEHLPVAFGVQHHQFSVRQQSKKIYEKFLAGNSVALEMAKTFCKKTRIYEDVVGAPIASRISVAGIDAGEAIMLAYAAQCPDVEYFTTGDKKCLRTLNTKFPDVANALNGKIRCFEQSLLAFAGMQLPQTLDSYFAKTQDVDTGLHQAVAVARGSPDFSASLKTYLIGRVKELHTSTGAMIDLKFPPGVNYV